MPKEEGLNILHHIMDGNTIEIFGYSIDLPTLPPLWGMDISITKHVVMMWLAAAIMLIIFPIVCNKRSLVPSGLRNLFEAILLFIRDDIVRPNIGEKDEKKYLPYLWTLFFFILFCNLLGLIPFGASATGNIAVTATLAVISFVVIHFAGIRENGLVHYLQTIVPHVPWWLWPLMFVVEVMAHLIRPFALTIRLFANMISGHILIMVILGFIFLFPHPAVIGGSVVMASLLYLLELFVALLQAYVFTFLTAVFMGLAIHPQH